MARKRTSTKQTSTKRAPAPTGRPGKPSALLDTRIVYCGDCLDQFRKLPTACVDLIYIDSPSNSNRNCEDFWGGKPRRSGPLRTVTPASHLGIMVQALFPKGIGDG